MKKLLLIIIIISCTSIPSISEMYNELEFQIKSAIPSDKVKCNNNNERACVTYLKKMYISKDKKTASSIAKNGCDKNIGIMCTATGLFYLADGNITIGEKYLTRACNLKSPWGCYVLARYEHRTRNLSFWRKHIDQACELGEFNACYFSQRNLPINNKISTKIEDACNNNNYSACLIAGKIYYERGNIAKAQAIYEEGCRGKDEESCYAREVLFNSPRPLHENIAAAQKSCTNGSEAACANLANDPRFNISKSSRLYYLNQTCLKDPEDEGCNILGRNALNHKKYFIAEQYFRLGCLYWNSDACHMLGYTLLRQDRRQESYKYLRLACHLNSSNACFSLGDLYAEDGKNTESLSLTKKACRLNNEKACLQLIEHSTK